MENLELFTAAPTARPGDFEFFIQGIPAPGGSKTAFPIFRKGPTGEKIFVRSIITDAGGKRNKDWKSNAGWCGREAMLKAGLPVYAGALRVQFHFTMPRLKAHFNSKGVLKPGCPAYHVSKPDLTKLIRSTEDGLKGVTWLDDNQIALQAGSKRYGDSPGCTVIITPINP